ncbi:hypothetical protein [Deinococcus saxicola]|uniref:hypothetical protein n=1 Tax=Deinococcus saxicola TaxID=249406 RepID=UPI0039F0C5C2
MSGQPHRGAGQAGGTDGGRHRPHGGEYSGLGMAAGSGPDLLASIFGARSAATHRAIARTPVC